MRYVKSICPTFVAIFMGAPAAASSESDACTVTELVTACARIGASVPAPNAVHL